LITLHFRYFLHAISSIDAFIDYFLFISFHFSHISLSSFFISAIDISLRRHFDSFRRFLSLIFRFIIYFDFLFFRHFISISLFSIIAAIVLIIAIFISFSTC